MKQMVFALLLFLNVSAVFAQQELAAYEVYEGYNWWNKRVGDPAMVFADMAYVRDYPSTRSRIVDSLYQGTEVKIISDGYNPATIRGFHTPWHKISYQINGKNKEGFIWLGLLAIGKQSDNNGNDFIYGILRYEKATSYRNAEYLVEIKCLDKNKQLLAREYYPTALDGQQFTEYKILPNMGLEGLESIHRIGFLGEACGISTNHYYFSWDGQKFDTMFYKTSVSDAGVFYYEEKILFPSEHQLEANLIIKDIEKGEVIDDSAQELQYKIERKREKYIWNGKHASLLMEMK